MAKQGKVLPARRPRGEDSLLIRSAESLGRAIGKLQRQLDRGIAVADNRQPNGDGATKTNRRPKSAKTTRAGNSSRTLSSKKKK